MCRVKLGSDTFEIDVGEKLRPAVERQLTGTTKLDSEIDALAIPKGPLQISVSIKLIRWYQKDLSPKLGSRCVFEPSCSHYCELSIRKNGFFRGIFSTLKRLYCCRPGNGGVDLPKTKRV